MRKDTNLCSIMNDFRRKEGEKALRTAFLGNGITLATTKSVKRSITYREITIAIGILVAMVIALTLWTRVPEEKLSGSRTSAQVPSKLLFGVSIRMFKDRKSEWPFAKQ